MSGAARYGLIEAGGTKFVVGIGCAGHILGTKHLPTTTPDETLAAVIAWLAANGPLAAVGIASFGPLDLDPASPAWGRIVRSPKPGWTGVDLAGALGAALGHPVAIDTDVNGAALAEHRWGSARGQKIAIYVTIGTGIGGGAIVDGAILRGLGHPEMGHIRVARHPDDIGFSGNCPFHGDCLEGLASGPAIRARWGTSLSELAPDHPGHAIIAHYLGQAVCTLQAILEPGRIILGGGVMATVGLLDRVSAAAAALGGGYFRGNPATILCAPGLGDRAGLMGALAIAEDLMASR